MNTEFRRFLKYGKVRVHPLFCHCYCFQEQIKNDDDHVEYDKKKNVGQILEWIKLFEDITMENTNLLREFLVLNL